MSTSNTLTGRHVLEPRERGARDREASHAGIAAVASVFQAVMLAAHWFVYETFHLFWRPMTAGAQTGLALSVTVLSFSFLAATLLAFRANNIVVRLVYRMAAVWLGALNFFVLAAV